MLNVNNAHATGAWWYGACHSVNINGIYTSNGVSHSGAAGVNWCCSWKGHSDSLLSTIMRVTRDWINWHTSLRIQHQSFFSVFITVVCGSFTTKLLVLDTINFCSLYHPSPAFQPWLTRIHSTISEQLVSLPCAGFYFCFVKLKSLWSIYLCILWQQCGNNL